MALIQPIIEQPSKPNTAAALELVGLSKSVAVNKNGLAAKLADHNLDTDSLLRSLSSLVHEGDSEALRLRAVEDAMKLNPETRLLTAGPETPIVNIIIKDNQNISVNPILFPREVFS